MKKSSKKILKSILLSSVFSLFGTNSNAAQVVTVAEGESDSFNEKDILSSLGNKIQKNVLKMGHNGEVKLIAGHRSHRSHSSHRSHRSSSSGSYSSGSSYRSSSGSSYSQPVAPAKTPATYQLGDRTLKEGVYGNDVTALVNLLVSKNYLRKDKVTMRSGYAVYDSGVKAAVIRFQNDAKLTSDGIAGTPTINQLKNWDASRTTLVLGIRDLKLNDSGDDVNELIQLLTYAGFQPDPSKLEYDYKGKAKYTEDVAMAIKIFQAHNQLTPTGNLDTSTLNKLRQYSR